MAVWSCGGVGSSLAIFLLKLQRLKAYGLRQAQAVPKQLKRGCQASSDKSSVNGGIQSGVRGLAAPRLLQDGQHSDADLGALDGAGLCDICTPSV